MVSSKYRIYKLGGHRFWSVAKSGMPSLLGESVDTDSDGVVLFPYHPPDDKLDFPAKSESYFGYTLASSGVANHTIERERPQNGKLVVTEDMLDEPFTATQLDVFDSLTMDFECLSVLNAHGWLGPRACVAEHIIQRVAEVDGPCTITKARLEHRDNWGAYVLERAALHFSRPLSRLWYAANLYALYYVHYDDLRVGYLWAEYKFRMRVEADAMRGEKVMSGARSAADAINSRHAEIRQRRLARMAELVPSMGVDRAAAQCELEGIGHWQAVKRQWNRARATEKKGQTRRCP